MGAATGRGYAGGAAATGHGYAHENRTSRAAPADPHARTW
jgi:hypothetical protein